MPQMKDKSCLSKGFFSGTKTYQFIERPVGLSLGACIYGMR